MISTLIAALEGIRPVLRPIIVAILLYGLWAGLARTKLDVKARATTWFAVAIPLLLWYAAVSVLVENGAFRTAPDRRFPGLPLAVVLPIIVGLPLLLRSSRIALTVDAIPKSWLVGIQAVRVLGGIFVVRWAQGSLPGAFALPAGLGDFLVGVLALPVAYYLSSGARGSDAAARAWNILGISDLAVAIVMGALTSPSPIQIFALDQPNTLSGDSTLVMIPVFFVPLFVIVHGLSLWQLRRSGAGHPAPQPATG